MKRKPTPFSESAGVDQGAGLAGSPWPPGDRETFPVGTVALCDDVVVIRHGL